MSWSRRLSASVSFSKAPMSAAIASKARIMPLISRAASKSATSAWAGLRSPTRSTIGSVRFCGTTARRLSRRAFFVASHHFLNPASGITAPESSFSSASPVMLPPWLSSRWTTSAIGSLLEIVRSSSICSIFLARKSSGPIHSVFWNANCSSMVCLADFSKSMVTFLAGRSQLMTLPAPKDL